MRRRGLGVGSCSPFCFSSSAQPGSARRYLVYVFLLSLTLAIHLRLLQLPLPRSAPRWLTLEATSPPFKHALRPFEHGNVEHARSSWNSATQARVLAVRFARDLATALSFPHLSMPTRTASSLRVAPTSEKKIRALPDEALRSEGGELGAERGRGSSGRRAETVETCQRVVIRSRLTVVLCVGARGRVGERWRWFPCEKRKDVSSLGLSKLSSCLAYLHRVA